MLFHNIIYFNSKMAVTANSSLILRDIRTQILKSVQQFCVVGGLFSVEHVLFSVVFGEGIEHSASEQPGCVQSPTSRPEDFKDGPAGFEHCKLHTLFMDSLDGVSYPGITVTPSSDGAPHTWTGWSTQRNGTPLRTAFAEHVGNFLLVLCNIIRDILSGAQPGLAGLQIFPKTRKPAEPLRTLYSKARIAFQIYAIWPAGVEITGRSWPPEEPTQCPQTAGPRLNTRLEPKGRAKLQTDSAHDITTYLSFELQCKIITPESTKANI